MFTAWPFVLALATLIVNDAWLKGAWPGLLTGKLSDFAGIAVVTMLGLRWFPRRQIVVCSTIALGFAWWKSPGSQLFIDTVNSVAPLAIGRIVDYSDLLALLVMPACMVVARQPERFALAPAGARRLLLAPIGAATVLGLMGTAAVAPIRAEYEVRTLAAGGALDRAFIANEIAKIAKHYALDCTDCASRLEHASFGTNLVLEYRFVDARSVHIKVSAPAKGMLGNRYSGEAERIRERLKARLGPIESDREFIDIHVGSY